MYKLYQNHVIDTVIATCPHDATIVLLENAGYNPESVSQESLEDLGCETDDVWDEVPMNKNLQIQFEDKKDIPDTLMESNSSP